MCTDPPNPASSAARLLELEVKLIEQDHRLIAVLHYYFTKRPQLPKDDPRRDASFRAVLWRIFSPQTAVTAGIGIISLLGLFFAYQANILLAQQNTKIDIQNKLAEASRRASLIVELTSINEKIDSYRDKSTDTVTLPTSLIGRIAALSRSLRPYQYITYGSDDLSSVGSPFGGTSLETSISPGVSLVERALSPERGQLLLTVASANINNLSELIEAGTDFRYADLRGVTLRNVQIMNADLKYADFRGAHLFKTKLSGSNLLGTRFDDASMIGVDFSPSPTQTDLADASFVGARLNGSTFRGAFVSNADFSNSLLFGTEFDIGAINANFEGAIICQASDTKDSECEKQLLHMATAPQLAFIDPERWRVAEEMVVGHKFADKASVHYVLRRTAKQ